MKNVDISCEKFFKHMHFPNIPNDAHSSFSMSEDGINWEHRESAICYADMVYRLKQGVYPYIFIRFGKNHLDNPLFIDFLRWVINDSFVADAFYTKDVEMVKTYGLQLNTLENPAFMISGAMVARTAAEFKNLVRTMKYITDMGFNMTEAYSFAIRFVVSADGKRFSPSVQNRNHIVISRDFDSSAYTKAQFLKHNTDNQKPVALKKLEERPLITSNWTGHARFCPDDPALFRHCGELTLEKVKAVI